MNLRKMYFSLFPKLKEKNKKASTAPSLKLKEKLPPKAKKQTEKLQRSFKGIEHSLFLTKRRSISVSISPQGEVKVRAPKRTGYQEIENFLEKSYKWILKKIQTIKEQSLLIKKRDDYIQDRKISYLGKIYNIIIKVEKNQKNSVSLSEEDIVISIKKEPENKQSEEKIIKNKIENFLKEKSKEVFQEKFNLCFEEFSSHLKYKKPQLIFKKMKSTWGYLKNRQIVCLNQNLIHFDEKFLMYIIFHELCHLKHSGHGRDFYGLQSLFVPLWKELRKELKYLNLSLR